MLKNDFNSGIFFLKNDYYFGPLINKMSPPTFSKKQDYKQYFESLAKYIIYQQLSIKAARKIYIRFLDLFPKDNVVPKNFKQLQSKKIRDIGISQSKIKYINNVADMFLKNKSFLKNINSLSDEEIINKLTQIKGIGPWTAEMFLMFTLCRLDVFPLKDLGIKKGIQKLFKLDTPPSDQFMLKKSKKWSPYRTICCLYLWKMIDGNNFEW